MTVWVTVCYWLHLYALRVSVVFAGVLIYQNDFHPSMALAARIIPCDLLH